MTAPGDIPNKSASALRGRVASGKLHPPVVASPLVERKSLLRGIRRRRHRLTLVAAAAGYGKTSLLSQWYALERETGRVRVAWLSLERADSDPQRFLFCLLAALNESGIQLDRLVTEMADTPQVFSVDQILSELRIALEQFSVPEILLMLDDFHDAQSEDVNRIVDFLLLRMPPKFMLVISTRVRPSIALPTLLARGVLLLVDDTQLRFSLDESRELFGDLLDEREHGRILEHTKGWGFALQMARILASGKPRGGHAVAPITGSSVDIAHYLTDQVMSNLPGAVQEFLIDTSFLKRVCAGLADDVRQRADSLAILDALEPIQASFINYDTDHLWYEYHPLFAEFLCGLLLKKGESHVAALRRRAALWYAQHDMLVDAIRQAVELSDRSLAARMLDAAGGTTILHTHGVTVLISILNLVPGKWIHQVPALTLGKALLMARSGDTDTAFQYMEEVRRAPTSASNFHTRRDLLYVKALWLGYADAEFGSGLIEEMETLASSPEPISAWLRGMMHTAAFLIRYRMGRMGEALSATRIAMAHYLDYGARYSQFYIHINQGMVKYAQGELRGAYRCYRMAEKLVERHFGSNRAMLAVAQLMLATVCYQMNRTARAYKLSESALPLVERYDAWPELYVLGYSTAFDCAYRQGGISAALQRMISAEQSAERRHLSRLRWHIAAKRVDLFCRDGQPEKASKTAEQARLPEQLASVDSDAGFAWSERQAVSLCLARQALYRDEPRHALRVLALGSTGEEADTLQPFQLRSLLLAMMARVDCGDWDEAARCLDRLLSLPTARSYLRAFIDEGPKLVSSLRKLVRHKNLISLPEGVNALVLDISAEVRKDTAHRLPAEAVHIGVLSSREMEILRELSAGLSNKAIAMKLEVTERTIKFHLQNIYRKLSVNGRIQALNVARRYQLI